MTGPLVSIITPSFNQGKFIETAIKSVQRQTYRNIEHIVIDAGSTDETIDILRKYSGVEGFTWLSEPDDGMYDAVNKGLRMSRGDILAYLNCDDLYLPWSVEIAIIHLSNCHIVFGDLIRWHENSNTIMPLFSPPFSKGYYSTFGFISQPTVFMKREVFDEIGNFNNINYKLIADCDYWLRSSRKYDLIKINEFLAVEREHEFTQRETKQQLLRKEFNRLRDEYSNKSPLYYNFCRLYNHMYWRTMIMLYKFYQPSKWWNRTIKSRIMIITWRDLLKYITTTGYNYRGQFPANGLKSLVF